MLPRRGLERPYSITFSCSFSSGAVETATLVSTLGSGSVAGAGSICEFVSVDISSTSSSSFGVSAAGSSTGCVASTGSLTTGSSIGSSTGCSTSAESDSLYFVVKAEGAKSDGDIVQWSNTASSDFLV